MRHAEYEELLHILEGVNEKRSIGRKKKSWKRNLRNWKLDPNGNDLIHLTQNRNVFSVMVSNLNRDGTNEEEYE